MKRLTFTLTVEVSSLEEINISYLEDQIGRSILSSEMLDVGPVDEMGAEANLLHIREF